MRKIHVTMTALVLSFITGLFGCKRMSQAQKPRFSEEQLAARFTYDLGPKEINVSDYPEKQKANYTVFVKVCSQCHTLARPINAPITTRKDWERYIQRMHLRSEARPTTKIAKSDAKSVVDFLTHDAQVRKVDAKEAFDTKLKELQDLFKQVQEELARLKIEEGKQKAREAAPYTGQ